jgi:CubicO group peptidase (beta-lactamase class C family)
MRAFTLTRSRLANAGLRTTCSAVAIGGLLVLITAAPEAKAQSKTHYHTAGGVGYDGTGAKGRAQAAAEKKWKVQVAAHDGSPWSNWAFAENKTVSCKADRPKPKPPRFEKPHILHWTCKVNARPCRKRPVTGPYVKQLSGLDDLMVNWMNKYGFKAATLAVLKDKKLVYERGYGYQDKNLTTPILPNARMRLATVSVVLTKRALRQLLQDHLADQSLKEDHLVYQVLGLPPWTGVYADERMKDIKIKHLLDDTSCLIDHAPPVKTIGEKMGLLRNATLAESIKYLWSQPSTMLPICWPGFGVPNFPKWNSTTLQIEMPEQPYAPQGSHFSMEVAAQIIAKTYANQTLKDDDPIVVGQKYGEYIRQNVGFPGAYFFQANNLETQTWYREIWYKSLSKRDPEWNRNWESGQAQVSDAYGIDFFARPGSGTIVAAGRDVARYLNNYTLDGNQRPANLAGYAWYGRSDGSLPGTSAIVVDHVWTRKIASTGRKIGVSRSFVVLVNMRNETITPDTSHEDITSKIESYLNGVNTWPGTDLF